MNTRKLSFVRKVKWLVAAPIVLLCHYSFSIPFRPLLRYKRHLISSWRDIGKRSPIDRLLFPVVFRSWIDYEYLREPDPDARENLKSIAMGGVGGKKWAATFYDVSTDELFNSKVGNMSYQEASPIHSAIDEFCSKDIPDVIIQIGSCSGRETALYARKYPTIECVGTDAFPTIVEFSQQCYSIPNLTFELFPAHKLIDLVRRYSGKNILIFSSGSLKYVQPEHLRVFFHTLVTPPVEKIRILIQQTANELDGDPDRLSKSLWQGNFKYTHGYKYYAEASGLTTIGSKIVRPYLPYKKFPKRVGIVNYFYSAKTSEVGDY